jgi:hypothetical protein
MHVSPRASVSEFGPSLDAVRTSRRRSQSAPPRQDLRGEPSLADALSDPVVLAMMAADNVDAASLESDLRELAMRIAPAPTFR